MWAFSGSFYPSHNLHFVIDSIVHPTEADLLIEKIHPENPGFQMLWDNEIPNLLDLFPFVFFPAVFFLKNCFTRFLNPSESNDSALHLKARNLARKIYPQGFASNNTKIIPLSQA